LKNPQSVPPHQVAETAYVSRYTTNLTRQGTAHAHMAQQMWEAVSSIGAQLEEGEVANSRRDMAAKHAIALREAREARYWFRLIAADPAWTTEVRWFIQESEEFVRMLTVSVRKLRSPPG
jgi:four helix bundle protein